MSVPVDVLQMFDVALYVPQGQFVKIHAGRAQEARAAVAELIEADKEYDAAIAEGKELNRKIAESGWFEVEFDALRKSGERIVRAQSRRFAALGIVGGAA